MKGSNRRRSRDGFAAKFVASRHWGWALDLAFIIDTTGSMADELSYIQSELDNIVGGIATQFPGIAQRWALVAYRDLGDEYVVRSFDFQEGYQYHRAVRRNEGANEVVVPRYLSSAEAACNPTSTPIPQFVVARHSFPMPRFAPKPYLPSISLPNSLVMVSAPVA